MTLWDASRIFIGLYLLRFGKCNMSCSQDVRCVSSTLLYYENQASYVDVLFLMHRGDTEFYRG
jgi:hypothetical protein